MWENIYLSSCSSVLIREESLIYLRLSSCTTDSLKLALDVGRLSLALFIFLGSSMTLRTGFVGFLVCLDCLLTVDFGLFWCFCSYSATSLLIRCFKLCNVNYCLSLVLSTDFRMVVSTFPLLKESAFAFVGIVIEGLADLGLDTFLRADIAGVNLGISGFLWLRADVLKYLVVLAGNE